ENHHELVLPPLFMRWDNARATTAVVANSYWRSSRDRFDIGVVPLYFGGRSAEGDYDVSPALFWSFRHGAQHSLLLPALATWHGGDEETETTFIANTYYQARPDGFTLTSFPLVFAGREGEKHHEHVLPPLFMRW